MPTGLRNPAVIGRVVAAMRTSEARWTSSLPQQRVEAIADVVIRELQALGVTAPLLQIASFPGLAGQFDFGPWKLQVDSGMAMGRVGQSPIPKIAELGDTILHEARHCEQWFRMGRLLATQRRNKGLLVDGREIGNRLGINHAMACAAMAAAPPLIGVELQEAEEWYGSVYGSQASFRSQTYATRLNSTGTDSGYEWQTSRFARYQRALAEEEDAWGLGTELQRQYLQHHPGVAPPVMSRHAPVRQGITSF